jgi:uncharacterized protein (TIGR00661 family)
MFVIQGEGRGHLTQALTLKQILEKNGHEVVDVMVGTSKNRSLPEYFLSKINLNILRFQSPNFLPSPKNKRPFLPASVLYNLFLLPIYIESIISIRLQIKACKPDVVVNFYELLCGLTYGLFNPKIPMVNIAHQYFFLTTNFNYEGKKRYQFRLLNLFTRFTALNSSKILALSFRREYCDFKNNIKNVPPLLRLEVLNSNSVKGNYIHGYILNDGFYNELVEWSKVNPKEKMHFFWDRKNAKTETKVNRNLTLHTLNDDKFIECMAGAKAYATTAGFESVCEAMYLQKPVLMVPTHIEQECNAIDAVNSGAGIFAENFDFDSLLKYIPEYKHIYHFRSWVLSAEEHFIYELTNIDVVPENVLIPLRIYNLLRK